MNTNTEILKWDVDLQKILVVINVVALLGMLVDGGLFYVWFYSLAISGTLQIISNVVHLLLAHKSIGYASLRLWHFWCSLLYIFFFVAIFNALGADVLRWVTMIIIPETVFFAYFTLCSHELNYLQHREFHILR